MRMEFVMGSPPGDKRMNASFVFSGADPGHDRLPAWFPGVGNGAQLSGTVISQGFSAR